MGLSASPGIMKARDRENAPPGLSLWQVLEIDERCIPVESRVAALKIAWWWGEYGRPAAKVVLSIFLHHAINACVREGIRYPKIVLKRLKQMQRDEWSPAGQSRSPIARRGGFMSVAEILR